MTENKENPVAIAKEKAEADGWVYFKYHVENGRNGLFKARPDGSELTCLAEFTGGSWSDLRNIRIQDGCIYFDVTESYSVLNEEAREFDRYQDEMTYTVKPDGSELMEMRRSQGYVGTSD